MVVLVMHLNAAWIIDLVSLSNNCFSWFKVIRLTVPKLDLLILTKVVLEPSC